MGNEPKDWAEWFAALAEKLVHKKQSENRAIIHVGTWDFAEEFELPVQLLIAETQFALLDKYARQSQPSFGIEAMNKMLEINRLRFEIAQREHPDNARP